MFVKEEGKRVEEKARHLSGKCSVKAGAGKSVVVGVKQRQSLSISDSLLVCIFVGAPPGALKR